MPCAAPSEVPVTASAQPIDETTVPLDRTPESSEPPHRSAVVEDAGSARAAAGVRERIGYGAVVAGMVAFIVALIGASAVLLRFSLDALGDRIDDTNAAVVANGERITRLEERMDDRFAQVDDRFAQVDDRFAQVDERFAQVDERFAQVDARFVELDERMDEVAENVVRILALLEARDGSVVDATLERDGSSAVETETAEPA